MSDGYGGADRQARELLKKIRAVDMPTLPATGFAPPSPVEFAAACGYPDLDEWQRKVLSSDAKKQLLLCCRQSGKSTVTAIRSAYEAAYKPGVTVLLLAAAQTQSSELHRKVRHIFSDATIPLPAVVKESVTQLELENGSRVLAFPSSEESIRGYTATLVVIDEAARVPDDVIAAIQPALATTNGRTIALSTPRGKRGYFWEQWDKGANWERTEIHATQVSRIDPDWLEDQRALLGEFMFLQEYECRWLDAETSVFSSDLVGFALSGDFAPMWPQGSEIWKL